MKYIPCDKILEDLLRRQLQTSNKFAPHLLLYENEIITGRSQRDYRSLHAHVMDYLVLEQRQAIQHSGEPTLYSYAAKGKGKGKANSKGKGKGKSSKGKGKGKSKGKEKGKGVPSGKWDCWSWMSQGHCPRGDKCTYWHHEDKKGSRIGTPYGPSKPRSSSPSPKRASSRTRPRGTSPSGKPQAPGCYAWLKGKCKKGEKCDYYHVQTCTFWREGKCNQGDKCMWLHREWKDNLAMASPAAAAPEEQPTGTPSTSGTPKEKAKAKRRGSRKRTKPKGQLAVYVPQSSTEEGDGCSRSALQSGEEGLSHSATTTGNEDNSQDHGTTVTSSSKGLGQGQMKVGNQKVIPGAFPSYKMQIVNPGGIPKRILLLSR